MDNVISVAAKLNSMVKILNYKLRKKNYSEISIGIGIDDGRALMIKAGYSGSGINDVIWMGDVVNSACHLCNKAGRNGRKVIIISSVIYSNLNEDNQSLFNSYFDYASYTTNYEGDIINTYMDNGMKRTVNKRKPTTAKFRCGLSLILNFLCRRTCGEDVRLFANHHICQ